MKRSGGRKRVMVLSDSDTEPEESSSVPALGEGRGPNYSINDVIDEHLGVEGPGGIEDLSLMEAASEESSAEDLEGIDSEHLFDPRRERGSAQVTSHSQPAPLRSQPAGVLSGGSKTQAKVPKRVSFSQPEPPPKAKSRPGPGGASGSKGPSNSSLSKDGMGPKKYVGMDVRKKYCELIESCQDYENHDGFDSNLQSMITTNIKTGEELFHEIGGGPGDMYLAFLHTKMCSGMIKYKTNNIGSHTSAFKVDLFLDSLIEKCVTPHGEYIPKLAMRCISSSATDCCKTLPHVVAIVGAFDRTDILEPKENKVRGAPRKKIFDDSLSQATQHEEVKFDEAGRMGRGKTNAESFSGELLKVLKVYKGGPTLNAPINFFEFTLDRSSFASTIESFFYIAFLIRDGDVCLYRQQQGFGGARGRSDATLCIKADKRPDKGRSKDPKGKNNDLLARRQFILSFSPKKWKAMRAIASGEDVIAEHKRRIMGTSGSGAPSTSKST